MLDSMLTHQPEAPMRTTNNPDDELLAKASRLGGSQPALTAAPRRRQKAGP